MATTEAGIYPAGPGERTTSRHKSVIDMITADHNKARALYEQYKLPGLDAQQRQNLAWSLIREVSMHSAKEEEVVYPAMREKMGDMAPDHLLSEHQQLKEMLSSLSTSSSAIDPNFDGKLQEMMQVLLHHMREEEQDLLPRFASMEGVDRAYLETLGWRFDKAKLVAPTRPHPWAPNKPPLNYVANLSAAPLDYLLDTVRFVGAPPS